MKLYITVTTINQTHTFEMITSIDPDLPWHDFVKELHLHKYLDKNYPDWQGYDIDIDEELIPKKVLQEQLPEEDDE